MRQKEGEIEEARSALPPLGYASLLPPRAERSSSRGPITLRLTSSAPAPPTVCPKSRETRSRWLLTRGTVAKIDGRWLLSARRIHGR